MIWSDFNQFSGAHGGTADLHPLTEASSPMKWLGDMLMGLQQISNSYQGDKNARGETYSVTSGVFENMNFNGGASRSKAEYLFGITLGVPLRLTSACMLLSAGNLSQDEKMIFDYVVKSSPEADEPPDFEATMAAIADPQRIASARSMTFFGLGFVWMHEAFHTLIGHVDFASEVLGLSLEELSMEHPRGFESDVLQALELDADGAALTNFCLTLKQSPRFGVVADGNVDPAHRVAQAAEGAIIALSILELQREQRGTATEGSHPNPSRRFANVMGMLRSFERRSLLPQGTLDALSLRIRRLQPAFSGTSMAPLLEPIADPSTRIEDDVQRLSDLIKLGNAELAIFEQTSFAPRVRL